jgi:hypothetical protein
MATGYKTGGRAKGTPNKLTRDLREMIWERSPMPAAAPFAAPVAAGDT